MSEEVTAVAMPEAETRRAVVQHSMSDLERMARAFAESGLFGAKTPQQALAILLIAQSEGSHPATAIREFDVISGRPAMKAEAMLARFQRQGGSIKWLERTDQRCRAKLSHPQGGEAEFCWDIERAKQANLTGKDNWRKHPAQMLSARVVSEGVRAIYPACLVAGVYTPEEVSCFEERPSVTTEPRRPNADAVSEKAQAARNPEALPPKRTPVEQIAVGLDFLQRQFGVDQLRVSVAMMDHFGSGIRFDQQVHADYLRQLCESITSAPAGSRQAKAEEIFSRHHEEMDSAPVNFIDDEKSSQESQWEPEKPSYHEAIPPQGDPIFDGPENPGTPPKGGRGLTEKQRKRVFAIAAGAVGPDDAEEFIHFMLEEGYEVKSTKELEGRQLKDFNDMIGTDAIKTWTQRFRNRM